MSKKITYLNDIQKDYFNLLNSKRDIIFCDNISLIEISKIVEEVDIFWRKNRDKFLFDLDYFSDKETLFLAGSMYLFLKITSIIISKLLVKNILLMNLF